MRQMRTVNPVRPAEMGKCDGLAYSLWLPEAVAPRGGIVVLHGAGSCKESHYDFARAALPYGLAVIVFDQRGHGESDGPMDARAVQDIASIATALRGALGGPPSAIAVRGSSMGGYLALVAAAEIDAAAVVAICPASGEGLRRGLAAGRFPFAADQPALDPLFAANDVSAAVARLQIPILLLHAEGDEIVPVQQSRELAADLSHPHGRLIAVPGGHHRSIQHDAEMQAVSLRFIAREI